ncbi:Coenzyme F420 hydrogenase/dehydrogenase, beta subunit C-terminal domain [Clostridium tarantellae]|uniref:4Fe-4S dicluster domain-containing protein n=1 Tax=Clostridium tarantellae TaxID=39493 RepID=A0A6I1MJ25_9CLOT|nr:Coenzyme F420 hydrogenase/dehydrogenase, beta subunit C-terminal domain [Clostridium tarantellae]MPQ43536.1 4Fe-4S dicluster domain-containing protein [Clostridium tarantellae]
MLDFDVKKLCYGCESCYNKCPKNAISMEEGEDGFYYPVIDKNKCIECKLCDKVCQVLNKNKIKNDNINIENKKCFAVFNKEEKIRMKSSSGGLFTVLSKEIILQGGSVFGAVFDENMNVIHAQAKTLEEISAMRGSKYSQSKIGNTYKEVYELLKLRKKVLFTGTPCQINGLYKFLGKEYEDLYTCDVVCHGVPSPLVFRKHLKSIENKDGKIKSYNFRNKETGWKSYSIKIEFENNKEKNILFNHDIYMKGFLNDLYLRNSCYNCKCKGDELMSDITIGDFWGIEKKYPKYHDNKGICCVMVNSKKGSDILEKVKEEIFIEKVNLQDILDENPSIIKAAKYNKKRRSFFKNINKIDVHTNIESNIKISIQFRIKRKIARILRKSALIK